MRTAFFLSIFLFFSNLFMHAGNNTNFPALHCLACTVPDGLTVSDLTGASATLSWNAVAGATQYTLEIQDEQNIPGTFHIETNLNGNTYSVTGLQVGVLYKFKVRTLCGGDKSDWSEWKFFTATNGGGGSGSTDCLTPTGLSVSMVGGVATLSWDTVSGAVKYAIEIEDEQNMPGNFHLEDFTNSNTYTFAGMQSGVLYKFKVRTHCANGQSVWSNSLFFNGTNGGNGNGSGNGSCAIPTGLLASNLTASEALLSWNAVAGVDSYLLEIELNQKNVAPWQITVIASTNSFLVTGLNANTRYKFKVRSNCTGGGHSKWTKWNKFKTTVSFSGSTGGSSLIDPADDRAVEPTEMETGMELKAWPNPVQNLVALRLQHLSTAPTTIRMFDLTGRVVKTEAIRVEGGTWEGALDLGQFSNGLYLLQSQNGLNTQTIKLVIAH